MFFRSFLKDHRNLTLNFETARCDEIPGLLRVNSIDIGFILDNKIEYKDLDEDLNSLVKFAVSTYAENKK